MRGKERLLKDILAKNLARYYSKENTARPCACSGFSCLEVGCKNWWALFLGSYSYEDIQKMVEIYEILKRKV